MPPEEAVPCAKCKEGLHLSCLNPVIIPMTQSSNHVLTFLDSRTFTCCDRQDFWTRPVYHSDEEDRQPNHPVHVPTQE